MNIKKLFKKAGALFLGAALFTAVPTSLTGCGASKGSGEAAVTSDGKTILKVGAAQSPHAEILEHIKPKLAEEGIDLQIVTLDTNDNLNPKLKDKEIDANYFQHLPFLESVAKEQGFDFKVAGKIHTEPMGFYSNKIKSIDELKDGDKIGVPNDASNEYRALKILEDNGLIKLKTDIPEFSATKDDIAENPKHLQFVEVDAAQLTRALDDLAGAVINTNYILDAGIDLDSAVIREDGDSPYANIVVVRNGDENRDEIKKLIEALQSDDVKNFLKEKYGNAVIPAF